MRTTKIKTVSYVRVGGELVNTEDLTQEQKVRLGTWLKTTYLNELYRGRAVFHPLDGQQADDTATGG